MLEFYIYKIISIIISLSFLWYSLFLKKISGNIHTPGSIYSFYWFLFTFFPIIFLYYVPLNPLALIYILISAIFFSISSLKYNWRNHIIIFPKNNDYFFISLNSKFLKVIFFISFFLAIIFPIFMLLQNGFNVEYFLLDWVNTSSKFASSRSNDGYEYGLIGQLSTFFPLFVASIGAVISFSFKKPSKKGLYLIISLLPALIFMLFQSSKIIFLYAFLFYISVTITLTLYSSNKILISKRILKFIFFFVLVFLPILIISFSLREGYNELDSDIFLPTILSYFFGSIFAFSDFFTSFLGLSSNSVYLIEPHYSLGYYSFKSFFDLFGGTKIFPPGYYNDFYNFNNYIQTNIFTFFRQLIQDFGILGSLIFIFFMGIIINYDYYLIYKVKNPFLSLTIFIIFLVFLGMSQMFNIFTTRLSMTVGIALYLTLKLNKIKYI